MPAAGAGGLSIEAMAGAPWWIVVPTAGITAVSGLLTMAGRVAEVWHWIWRFRSIRRQQRALHEVIERTTRRLQNPRLTADKRGRLINELTMYHQMLAELHQLGSAS